MSAPFSHTPYPIKFSSKKRISIQPKLNDESTFIGQTVLPNSNKRKVPPLGSLKPKKKSPLKSDQLPFLNSPYKEYPKTERRNIKAGSSIHPSINSNLNLNSNPRSLKQQNFLKNGSSSYRERSSTQYDDEITYLSEFNGMIESMKEKIRNAPNISPVFLRKDFQESGSSLDLKRSLGRDSFGRNSLSLGRESDLLKRNDYDRSRSQQDFAHQRNFETPEIINNLQDKAMYIRNNIQYLLPEASGNIDSESNNEVSLSLLQRFEIAKSRIHKLWEWLEVDQEERDVCINSYFSPPSEENLIELNKSIEDLLFHRADVLKVLERISEREEYIKKLKAMISRFEETRLDKNTIVLGQAAVLVNQIRKSTRRSLEAIYRWLNSLKKPKPFMWKGIDYLEKIRIDATELNQSTLVSTLQGMSPEMKQKLYESAFGSSYEKHPYLSSRDNPKLHTEKRFHNRYQFMLQKQQAIENKPRRNEPLPSLNRSHRNGYDLDLELEPYMDDPYFESTKQDQDFDIDSLENDNFSEKSFNKSFEQSNEAEEYWAQKSEKQESKNSNKKLKPLKVAPKLDEYDSESEKGSKSARSKPNYSQLSPIITPQTARTSAIQDPELVSNVFQRKNLLQNDSNGIILNKEQFAKTLEDIAKNEESALIIQTMVRSFIDKKKYMKEKKKFDSEVILFILLQSSIRMIIQKNTLKELIAKKNKAIQDIQRFYRGYLSRRETSVLKIVREMENEESLIEEQREYNITLIQSGIRTILIDMSHNDTISLIRFVDLHISDFYRNLDNLLLYQQIKRHTQTHVLFLQSRIRGQKHQLNFINAMKRIIKVQSACRTYSIVWQIVDPKRNNAAIIIQSFWRKQISKKILKEKKIERDYQIKLNFNTKFIQKILRKNFNSKNTEKDIKLIYFSQNCLRRSYTQSIFTKELFLRKMHLKRDANAVIIQTQIRGYLSRKRLRELKHLKILNHYAKIIQMFGRMYLSKENIKERKEHIRLCNEAASCIQRAFRIYIAKKQLQDLKDKERMRIYNLRNNSALIIQLVFKNYQAYKIYSKLKYNHDRLMATQIIQRYSRMIFGKDEYKIKKNIVRTQSIIRSQLQLNFINYLRSLPSYDSEESWCLLYPITTIQSAWRIKLIRKKLKISLVKNQISNIIQVQSSLKRNYHFDNFRNETYRIVLIQSQLRQFSQRNLLNASIISRVQRTLQGRGELFYHLNNINRIILVQSVLRSNYSQKRFVNLRNKIVFAWTQMMIGGVSLIDYCALTIQQAWRIYKAKGIALELKRNHSALIIQSQWRIYKSKTIVQALSKEYEKSIQKEIIEEKFANRIQKVVRGHLARKLAHHTRLHDKEAYIRSLYTSSFEKVADKLENFEKNQSKIKEKQYKMKEKLEEKESQMNQILESVRKEIQEREKTAELEIIQLKQKINEAEDRVKQDGNQQLLQLQEVHQKEVEGLQSHIKLLKSRLEQSESILEQQHKNAKRLEDYFLNQIEQLKDSLILLQSSTSNPNESNGNQLTQTKIKRTLLQDRFLRETCRGSIDRLQKYKDSVKIIENAYIAYKNKKQNNSALTIQLTWKRYKSIKLYNKLKSKEDFYNENALIIQKTYRSYRVRKLLKQWNGAAFIITRFMRFASSKQRKQSLIVLSPFKK